MDVVHGKCLFYRAINDPINMHNVTNYLKINQRETPVRTCEGVKLSFEYAPWYCADQEWSRLEHTLYYPINRDTYTVFDILKN